MENYEYVKTLSDNIFELYKNLNKAIKNSVENTITVPQFNVLKALIRENGLSLKELSGKVGLAHSTVSGIIDRLEEKKIVERKPDIHDKRLIRIYLTEVANMHKEKYIANIFTSLSDVITTLNVEEKEKMLDGLLILNRLFKEDLD